MASDFVGACPAVEKAIINSWVDQVKDTWTFAADGTLTKLCMERNAYEDDVTECTYTYYFGISAAGELVVATPMDPASGNFRIAKSPVFLSPDGTFLLLSLDNGVCGGNGNFLLIKKGATAPKVEAASKGDSAPQSVSAPKSEAASNDEDSIFV